MTTESTTKGAEPASSTGQSEHILELVNAAQAVVKRWHSTSWKDAPTADYINRLERAAQQFDAAEAIHRPTLDACIARLEQGFGKGSAPVTVLQGHFPEKKGGAV